MPRVVGPGPNGGTLVERDDGTTFETAMQLSAPASAPAATPPAQSAAQRWEAMRRETIPSAAATPSVQPPPDSMSVPAIATPRNSAMGAAPPALLVNSRAQQDLRNTSPNLPWIGNVTAWTQEPTKSATADGAPIPIPQGTAMQSYTPPAAAAKPEAPAAPTPPVAPVYRPATGGRVIPAHEEARTRTEQTTSGLELPPEVRQMLDAQRDAAEAKAKADEDLTQAAAFRAQQERFVAENMATKQAAEDNEVMTARAKQLQQLNAEVDNAKIDPSQALPGGTGGTILAALAIGMGTYGSIKTGSQNVALDLVNRAIDRGVQAQRENLQKSKEKRANVIAQWGSEDEYLVAQRAKMKTAAIARLDEMQAGMSLDAAQESRAQAMRSAMAGDIAKQEIELAERTSARVVNSRTFAEVQQQTVGGSGGGVANGSQVYADLYKRYIAEGDSPEKATARAADVARGLGVDRRQIAAGAYGVAGTTTGSGAPVSAEERKAAEDMAARFVPEAGGYARDATQARKITTAAEARNNLLRNYARIKELRSSYSNRISPSARGELDALVADNTIQWKNLGELGVLSADDRELIAPLTGQGALDIMSSPRDDAKLATAIQIVNNRMDAATRAAGITPGQEVMTQRGVRGVQTGVAQTATERQRAAAAAAALVTPAGGGKK